VTDVLVRLSDEARSFVEQQVAARQFASASEFIASLIDDAKRRAAVERVDQMLLEGLASGPGEEATPEWWAKEREEQNKNRRGAAMP
jgi:antitoxin ParD1/3/4